MEILSLILWLLIIFQTKHFVADYLLQNRYMLGKFRPDWGFFFPLLAHAGVHGVCTLLICLAFNPVYWWLSLIDVVAHFVMDRVKAGPKYLGRFNDKTKPVFWIALGGDQMFHHLTHYFFIYVLVMAELLK